MTSNGPVFTVIRYSYTDVDYADRLHGGAA